MQPPSSSGQKRWPPPYRGPGRHCQNRRTARSPPFSPLQTPARREGDGGLIAGGQCPPAGDSATPVSTGARFSSGPGSPGPPGDREMPAPGKGTGAGAAAARPCAGPLPRCPSPRAQRRPEGPREDAGEGRSESNGSLRPAAPPPRTPQRPEAAPKPPALLTRKRLELVP